jgi:hypothetical protein
MLHERRGERQMATVGGVSVMQIVRSQPYRYFLSTKDVTRITIGHILRSFEKVLTLHDIGLVFIHQLITMAKKKKPNSAAPGELNQPTENNVHAGEEVVADNTPGTSADKVPADATKRSGLEIYESTTSYAET